MLHTLRFSLQNAVNFIMLPFCFPIIHILYTGVLKFKCKTQVPKGLLLLLYICVTHIGVCKQECT